MPEEWFGDWLLPVSWLVVGAAIWLQCRRAIARSAHRGDLYRSIVETQTELICRYRPDTTLTFVNDAYCRYFGRHRHQLVGQSFFILIPESTHAAAREHINRLLTSHASTLTEHEVFRPDGSSSWQEWWDSLIVGPNGEVVELQAVGRDITNFRSIRHRVEQQHHELVHLSRVALLGQLTGPLAHEISQPVAAILSNAQATLKLLEQPSTKRESVQEIIQDIADGAERARLVIHSLRGLLHRGQSVFGPLDLNLLILDTTAFMRSALQISRVQVRYCLTADLPLVSADRIQLQQVILNLILNARDAMESTDPTLRTLDLTTLQTPDGCVECSIRDSGVGISEQCLPHIFEPYFSTKKHGLGLGLSICRSIVTAHRGHLWVNSNDGPGMTFVFLLQATA